MLKSKVRYIVPNCDKGQLLWIKLALHYQKNLKKILSHPENMLTGKDEGRHENCRA